MSDARDGTGMLDALKFVLGRVQHERVVIQDTQYNKRRSDMHLGPSRPKAILTNLDDEYPAAVERWYVASGAFMMVRNYKYNNVTET